jgi:DNA-binding Xre family transcriptional regulator
MAIIINIDVMLAKRKMSVTELSERVGITMANLSILKNGKAKQCETGKNATSFFHTN